MSKGPEVYQPLRIESQSRGGGVAPLHAALARRSAEVVLDPFLRHMLRTPRGKPVVPIAATLESRHRPYAQSDPLRIPTLVIRHPEHIPVKREFWLFKQHQLDRAHLVDREEFSLLVVTRLMEFFEDTPYLRERTFWSGMRHVAATDLVLRLEEAVVTQPEAPFTTHDIAMYALGLGNIALLHTTGHGDVGGANFYYDNEHPYVYTPRAQRLVAETAAHDGGPTILRQPYIP